MRFRFAFQVSAFHERSPQSAIEFGLGRYWLKAIFLVWTRNNRVDGNRFAGEKVAGMHSFCSLRRCLRKILPLPDIEPKPSVEIDLRQFGYLHPVAERDEWSYQLLSDPLLFLDSDHLAASFLVANPKPGLSERANPFGSPVLFHTADIDLATGKATWARSWGNDSTSEALLPLDGGKLLVQSGYVLSVLGSDLTPLVSRRLEYAGDTLAQPFVSTTGRTLYLVQPTNPESAIAILDPDQLRVLKEYAVPRVVTFSASDEYIAYSIEEGYFGNMSMRIQSLERRRPAALTFQHGNCYGYSPTFLSARTLVVSGGCPNFTFVDLSTKEMWQQKLPESFRYGIARRSQRKSFCIRTGGASRWTGHRLRWRSTSSIWTSARRSSR